MLNQVYKLRTQDRSKTVFVNQGDYQTTLDYGHKSGLDTSISRDFMRIGFTARRISRVEKCGDSCGKPRVETCNWNTPVLYGMEPGYYIKKIDQLILTAATALLAATQMRELEVGIQPDFGNTIDLSDWGQEENLSDLFSTLGLEVSVVLDALKARSDGTNTVVDV